jgi:hypothetical protein
MDFDLLGLGTGQPIEPPKLQVPEVRLEEEK